MALQREFAAVDSDSDQRIRKTDQLPAYLRQSFDVLDRDGDEHVAADELAEYVERVLPLEATAQADRLTLLASETGGGLFDLLDRNQDGQLGVREARAAKGIVLECDTNRDGRVSRGEIPRSFHLTLMRGALAPPYQTANALDAGPIWFYRMDRNRDGDLSFNEFLGRRTLFTTLDTDRDELISIGEALRGDGQHDQ